MAYEGGYTSAVNSSQQRAYEQAQIQQILENVEMRRRLEQQEQEQRQKDEQAGVRAVETLRQLDTPDGGQLPRPPQPQGAQPPPPGQASMPMMPPPGPMGAGPLPPPPMPQAPAGQQPGMPMPGAQGAPMPPGAMPPMMPPGMGAPMPPKPPGWQATPGAPPSLGGQPSGATAGAGGLQAGQIPPPPGALGAQPGAGPAAAGAGPQQGVVPPQWYSFKAAIEAMDKLKIPPDKQYATLAKLAPLIEGDNKRLLDKLRIEAEVQKAATNAAKERRLELTGGAKAVTPTGFQKEAEDLYGKGTPEYKKAIEKHIARMDRIPGTTVNVGGGLTEDAKRLAAEQYLASGQLPAMYRDQKGRAAIMDMAAQIQKERGGEVSDVPGARAGFKADAASLTQLTRRTDALEQSSKKIDKDITTLDRFLDSGTAGSVTLVNKPINVLRTQFSDPELSKLVLAAQIVGTEYERMINGGLLSIAQLHEGAREDAHKLLNADMTPKQMREIVKVMRQEINNQRSAFKEQLSEVRGRMKGRPGAAAEPTGKATPPPTNGKGWKLHQDKNGNYAYVSPDGKQAEEVK